MKACNESNNDILSSKTCCDTVPNVTIKSVTYTKIRRTKNSPSHEQQYPHLLAIKISCRHGVPLLTLYSKTK